MRICITKSRFRFAFIFRRLLHHVTSLEEKTRDFHSIFKGSTTIVGKIQNQTVYFFLIRFFDQLLHVRSRRSTTTTRIRIERWEVDDANFKFLAVHFFILVKDRSCFVFQVHFFTSQSNIETFFAFARFSQDRQTNFCTFVTTNFFNYVFQILIDHIFHLTFILADSDDFILWFDQT
ncbi:hypothetical protein D3C72_1554200 [compost metagenome]